MRTHLVLGAVMLTALCVSARADGPLAITITTTSLPNGVVGQPYSAALNADGPHAPFTWRLSGGQLPAGLSLSSGGQLTGTPTSAGAFQFTVVAVNTEGQIGGALIGLQITAAITIQPSSLPNGQVGVQYSQTFHASGGTGPYQWSVASGSPPAGISLSAGGQLSGTPTAAGTFSFTVKATDTNSNSGTASVALVIAPDPPAITTTSLPNGQVGAAYSQSLQASGGTPPYSWSIAGGSLPAGLTLSSSGQISGTPTAAGTSNFTAKVTDANSGSATKALSIKITAAPVTITTTSLPNGQVGAAYSQSLQASGGTPPYSWSIADGALPAGLTLSSSGQISGTPTAAGTSNFTAKVTDANSGSATKALSINITAAPVTITTASLPNGQVGAAYSQSLQASGGTPPYSWSIAGGSLPAGLTLSSSGQISGTPTAAGTSNFTAKVTDANSGNATKALSINITAAPVTITTASLPNGQVGAAYSQSLQASGGTPPYSWSIADGALPAGLTLSSSGQISGTPTAAGTSNFIVKATDSNSVSATQALSINVAAAAVVITTGALPSGQVGVAYSQSLQASGGTPPYSWSVAGGALPAGLTLSGEQISGTPAAAGNSAFTVSVRDSAGATASKNLSISIGAALTINGCPSGSAVVGQAYSSGVSASGGSPPYAWTTSGSLPPGIALDRSSGSFSGTPTQAGGFPFGIVVTDSASGTASKSCTINVSASLLITTGALPQGTTSILFSQQLSASGGTPPYTWSLASGSLPGGLTLSSSGSISGYPNAAGSFVFTVRVTDSAGIFAEKSFTLAIGTNLVVGCPASVAVSGQLYSSNASASGGQPPYTWSLTGVLPAGLTLSATGQLSGTPSYSGTFSYGLNATDKNGMTGSQQCTLTIAPNLAIVNASLPDASLSVAYSQALSASGGRPPYAWSVTSGALPAGLTLSPAGVISGSPSQTGQASFTIQVTDANGNIGQKTLTINVVAGLIVPSCPANAAEMGLAFRSTLAAAGGTPPYSWSLSSGGLSPGLTLDAATGVVSGTPTQAGTAQFTLMVTDANSQTATRQCSINVSAALAVSTASLAAGVPAAGYSDTVAASGGQPPYTWSTTAGSLPPGLSLNSATGQITGIPTATGTFGFTVQVIDSIGGKSTRDLSILITMALSIPACPTPVATVGQSYSASLVAAGGAEPYSWSISSGSLPSGLSMDAANAVIAGVPSQAGVASYVLQVNDANGKTTTRACTIQVTSVALTIISSATLPEGIVGSPYSQTLTAAGGRPPYSWSLPGPGVPQGLSLDASGTLSGTPETPGSFLFTAQVTDQDKNTAQQTFALTIVPINPPNVTVVGLPDVVDAAQQPAFSLQLDSAYPSGMSGTLTLTFTPDPAVGVDDPAVQFATGGRTLTFTVAANSNTAVFSSPVVALQTGTVAGTIQLAVSIRSAGTDITTTTQQVRTIRINPSAPKIVSLKVIQTSGGLEVHLIGFATTREVTQGIFRFQPANGGPATEVTVAMTDSGTAWFRSAASTQFGGQFSLTQPFTLQGQSLSSFSSLSVMLSNSQGNSDPSVVQF